MSARSLPRAALARLVATRCALRIDGGERLANARGPLLLISNHRSRLDTLCYHRAVGAPLTICGARAAYFESAFRRAAMRLLNVRPAGEERERFVDDCTGLLADGEVVLLFPEMRTNRAGLGEFRDWAAAVAIESAAPVLPCAIAARGERTRDGVSIVAGVPIGPARPGTDPRALTRELHAHVARLLRSVAPRPANR